MNKFLLSVIIQLVTFSAYAQLTGTPTPAVNALDLVRKFAGKGIVVSNASLTCPNGAAAIFNAVNTSLGIDSGIVLTTGNVLTYTSGGTTNYGVNNAATTIAQTDNLTSGGDVDLAASAGQPISSLKDMCKLEFDFIPLSDTIKFNYKFASEEYPKYNCTQFSDIFGFYITSGPNITVPKNIALVPGTNIPVSVNSINDGTVQPTANIANCNNLGPGSPFTSFYVNNLSSTSIVYDGITTILEARAVVTPCSTYHLKLAIADLADPNRDSGIFLKDGSLRADAATIDSITSSNPQGLPKPFAMEGCNPAIIYLSRPQPRPTPLTVTFATSGTAINGIDFTIPASVVIPANATTTTFNLTAILDAVAEGVENIQLYVYGSQCQNVLTDSATIYIKEFPTYTVSNNDTICLGQSVTNSATVITADPNLTFTWNPGNVNASSITVSPTTNTIYTCSAKYPGCINRDTLVTINVSPIPTVNAGLDKTICQGLGTLLNGNVSNYLPYGIVTQWTPTSGLSNSTILNPSVTTSINTTYTLTAVNSAGCSATDAVIISVATPITLSANTSNNLCNGASAGSTTITAVNNIGLSTYILQPGNLSNTTGIYNNLGAGGYTIGITDANGCTANTNINIAQGVAININNPTVITPNCIGLTNGSISISANGGFGLLNFTLNPGAITNGSGVFNNLAASIYTITVKDGNNCTKTSIVTVPAPIALTWNTASKTDVTCNGGSNGAITTVLTGGTGPYSYTILPINSTNTNGFFTSLLANTYTVTGTDNKGCTKSTAIVLNQPAGMTFGLPTKTNPSCSPGNNGSINIIATGGPATINYTLAPNNINNATGNFTNLGIGAFTITATDGTGCTKTTVTNLAYTNAPAFNSSSSVGVLCNGNNNGSISTNATGGVGAINYTLTPGNIINSIGSFSNLIAGSYTVVAKDNNQCTSIVVLTVSTPAVLNFNTVAANGPLCFGNVNGNITISMTGGTTNYNFTLSPGVLTNTTGSFTNLNIGSYTVNITDAKGCTRSSTLNLTQPSAVNWLGNNIQTNINCNGANTGSSSGTASGGTGIITYTIAPSGISNTSGNFTNLPAGTFTVTASDANNCSITRSFILTQQSPIIVTSNNINNASCSPGNDGSFNIVGSGGVGPYSYSVLATVNSTGIFNNLGNGNYLVTVTDALGCTKTSTVALPVNPSPSITQLQYLIQLPCAKDSSDSIKVIVSPIGNYTYTLAPYNISNTSGLFKNLAAGPYTITVKNANNCTAITIFTIQEPLPLNTFAQNLTQPACSNNTTGSVDVDASGGVAPYRYKNLANADSNFTGIFSNLFAGAYSIQVSDINGCLDTFNFNIAIPLPLTWGSSTQTNILCNGINNGVINPIVTGGTGAINYTLNPGGQTTSTSFTNLAPGTYTVIASDVNNCTNSKVFTLTTAPPFNISAPNITAPSCIAPTSGAIGIAATGGTGAINYTINATTNTSGTFSGLTANTYTVIAKDGNNCTKSSLVVLVVPNSPTINTVLKTNVSCNGGNNGYLSIIMGNGASPFTYSFNGGVFNAIASYNNLTAGNYTISVKDNNTCTISSIISITQPGVLTLVPNIINNLTCFGANNGSLNLGTTGGTGLINYTLNPGNITNTTGLFNNLTAQVYTISLKDANNCIGSSTINITAPIAINISSPILVQPSCVPNNNGSINATATGGAGSFTYTLIGVTTNSVGLFNNLVNGTYTFSAKDGTNCTQTITVVLQTPNAPILNTAKTNVTCFGGTNGAIIASSTGGSGIINYQLLPNNTSNTTGSFTNLISNTYTVIATDAIGCSNLKTELISQANQFFINITSSNNPLCNNSSNGSISATNSGGFGSINFTLLPNNTTNTAGNFTGLQANTFTVSAKDGNNCTVTTSVVLANPSVLTFNAFNTTNILCQNNNTGIISVLGNGGTGALSYTLNPGNVITALGGFSNLIAGAYTVTLKDANNCSISSNTTLTQPSSIVNINSFNNTIPTCIPGNDATLNILASGGTGALNYSLNTGASNSNGIFTNVGISTLLVTVTDANACKDTQTVVVTNPNAPIVNGTLITIPTCYGGNNGAIKVNSSNGTGSVLFSLQPSLITNYTGIFNGLAAGNYTINLIDSVGCVTQTTAIVNQPAAFNYNVSNSNVALCFGSTGNISVTANGGTGSIGYVLLPLNINNATGQFINVAASTYTLKVTDANSCTGTTLVSVATPPAIYWAGFNSAPVSCNGGSNGNILGDARGGTGTVTYSVNPGGLSNFTGLFFNLAANAYTITVTDGNGCTLTSLVNVIQPPALSYGTINITPPSCVPGNDAVISVVANGGVPNYLYSFNGGSFNSTATFSNLGINSYTIGIKDANNCTYTQAIPVVNPSAPTLSIANNTPVACFGQNNGSITTSSTGGTGTKTYTLMPNNINNTSGLFTTLIANNYSITVKDINNCTTSISFTITQPNVLNFTNTGSIMPKCFGNNNGSIIHSTVGGNTNINYLINPGLVNNNLDTTKNLTANTYTVLATDNKGCTISTTILLTQPPAVSITNFTKTNPTCFGGNNGKVSLNPIGGTGTLNTIINPNASTFNGSDFINLIANINYTITVTDANNCITTTSFILTQPTALNITSLSNIAASCVPGGDGFLNVAAIGGTGGIIYSVSNGGSTVSNSSGSFSNMSNITYTVSATDANACVTSSTTTLLTPNPPIVTNLISTPASCDPDDNGTINFNATSGAQPYTFIISSAFVYQSTGSFNGLFAGTYTATARDILGCTGTSTVNVSTTIGVNIQSATATPITCFGLNNGGININANTGTLPYSYILTPVGTNNIVGNFTNVVPNNYTATVIDANGCTATTTINVTQPSQLNFNSLTKTNITCFNASNGTINSNATGGTGALNYTLNPGNIINTSGTYNNLNINTFTIQVKDANNCNTTTAVIITQPTAIAISSTQKTDVVCKGQNNGSITVQMNGGTGTINYTLQPGNITNTTGVFNGLGGNTYTVVGTDGNNCTRTTSVFIFEPNALVINNIINTPVTCSGANDGKITAQASGGVGAITYNLAPFVGTNSTGVFVSLGALNYTLTVKDTNNCTATANVTITQPSPFQITNLTTIPILCFNGTDGAINLNVVGGNGSNNFAISPSIGLNANNGSFTQLSANTYSITITDAKGCTTNTTVSLLQPSGLNLIVDSFINLKCNSANNGAIYTQALGGTLPYTFTLLPNGSGSTTGNFFNLSSGNYTVVVTDDLGCTSATPNLNVTQPLPITLDTFIKQNVQCYSNVNGSLKVIAKGGVGNFIYTLLPIVEINTIGLFDSLLSGNYTLSVVDAGGCTGSTVFFIEQNALIQLTDVVYKSPTCYGQNNGSITFKPVGGVAPLLFSINNGPYGKDTFFNNLFAGSQFFRMIDTLGCTRDTILTLTQPDSMIFKIDSLSTAFCEANNNGLLKVSASGGNGNYTFALTPGLSINKNGVFANLQSGNYIAIVTDSLGCKRNLAATIKFEPNTIKTSIIISAITCFGNGADATAEATVTGGYPPFTYLWNNNPTSDSSKAVKLSNQRYSVTVTDDIGCTKTDSIDIPASNCCELYTPNAFTPNNDDLNDYWSPVTQGSVTDLYYAIYDRWGNKVFSSIKNDKGWDGTYKGVKVDANTFFFYAKFTCGNSEKQILKKGDILLLK